MPISPSNLKFFISNFIGKSLSQIVIEYQLPKKNLHKKNSVWYDIQLNYIDSIKFISFQNSMINAILIKNGDNTLSYLKAIRCTTISLYLQ